MTPVSVRSWVRPFVIMSVKIGVGGFAALLIIGLVFDVPSDTVESVRTGQSSVFQPAMSPVQLAKALTEAEDIETELVQLKTLCFYDTPKACTNTQREQVLQQWQQFRERLVQQQRMLEQTDLPEQLVVTTRRINRADLHIQEVEPLVKLGRDVDAIINRMEGGEFKK